METWQERHVKDNLEKLIRHTNCDELTLSRLISMKTLAPIDVENILYRNTNTSKAYRLYELAQPRVNGYAALISALQETNQTGALGILVEGVSQYGLQEMKVSFDKKCFTLKELILSKNGLKELEDNLKTVISTDEFFKFVLSAQDHKCAVKLVKATIPKAVPYYVERLLSKRMKIDPNIFKEKCADIFVFRNIPRYKLTEIAKPNLTSISTKQLSKISARFISLEKNEVDWEEILRLAGDTPVHFIEYVEGTKENFVLIETSGNSNILRNFLHHGSTSGTTPSISELEFIDILKQTEKVSSGICICDSPGMGKSLLLASLSRKISEETQNNIVSFVPLAEFIKNIKKPLENLQDAFQAIKLITKYICPSATQEVILLHIIQNKLVPIVLCFDAFDEIPNDDIQWTKEFLKVITHSNYNIKLLVTARPHMRSDLEKTLKVIAYDIVPFTENNQILYLKNYWLSNITDNLSVCSNERLEEFGTHCLRKLKGLLPPEERDLMGIPLQCYLLAVVNLNQARIYSDTRRKMMSPEEILVATSSMFELFKSFVDLRLNTDVEIETSNYSGFRSALSSVISVANFVQKQYTKYVDNRMLLSLNQKREIIDLQTIRDYHIWKALQLLYPEFAPEFAIETGVNQNLPIATILKYGILEPSFHSTTSAEVQFVHRTIAEFLVSNLFGKVLTEECSNTKGNFRKNILNLFFTVLNRQEEDSQYDPNLRWFSNDPMRKGIKPFYRRKFENILIASFVNWNLQTYLPSHGDIDISSTFSATIQSKNLINLLNACVNCNCVYLLRFIKEVILCLEVAVVEKYKEILVFRNIDKNKHRCKFCLDPCNSGCHRYDSSDSGSDWEEYPEPLEMQPSSQILHLASLNSTQMLKECVDLFETCFKWNISTACSLDIPAGIHIPFHNAVRNADYEMVEYFGQMFSVNLRQLLYYCVENTANESVDLIEEKLNICELLLSLSGSGNLVNERAFNIDGKVFKSPLFVNEVHFLLIKYLVKNGADFRSTRRPIPFVEEASMHLSPEDFEDFVRFLKDEGKLVEGFDYQNLLHSLLSKNWTTNHMTTLALKTVLETTNIDPNSLDENGDTLLLAGVRGNQSLELIEELILFKADLQIRDKDGKTVLHLAAEKGNVELSKYFLSSGLSLEDVDSKEFTPLMLSSEHLEAVKFFLGRSANFCDINYEGNTFLHLAASIMLPGDFYEFCEFLLENPEKFVNVFSKRNEKGKSPIYTRLECKRELRPKDLDLLLGIPEIDINECDKFGNNLIFAGIKGWQKTEILESLVKRGVNPSQINENGENILHLAVGEPHLKIETFKYIVSLGVNAEQKDNLGKSPLDKANDLLRDEDNAFFPDNLRKERLETIRNLLQEHIKYMKLQNIWSSLYVKECEN